MKTSGSAGAAARRRQAGLKPSPLEQQLNQVFSYPISIVWSNGEQTISTLGKTFTDESDYQRYKKYKDAGKPYPIRVEAAMPTDSERDEQSPIFQNGTKAGDYELVNKMCVDFSAALKRYLEGAEL